MQPVHRIDQPVAGLVVLSRGADHFRALHDAIERRAMHRRYIAVVDTPPDPPEGTLIDRITVDTRRNKSVITSRGKRSQLTYRTLGATHHHTVVEVTLETGRHHQIRLQLAERGWHVVGDTKYGARRPLREGGIALLAYQLSFPHPITGDYLTFRASFPDGALWKAAEEVVTLSNRRS